jgi:hypothetical protein
MLEGVFTMKIGRFVTQFQYSMTAAILMTASPWHALAQNSNSNALTRQHHQPVLNQQSRADVLLKIVRESTERFKDVSQAVKEGYALQFGCVSGPDWGAMGLHYVNGSLVGSGVIDATRPQIVIYEPTPNGGLKLIGADYLVLADMWNAQHPEGPPQLTGQLFHYFESPNRFGLPAVFLAWMVTRVHPFPQSGSKACLTSSIPRSDRTILSSRVKWTR